MDDKVPKPTHSPICAKQRAAARSTNPQSEHTPGPWESRPDDYPELNAVLPVVVRWHREPSMMSITATNRRQPLPTPA